MITGETIVETGLERFPELRGAYDTMLQQWQGELPGRYNVFMDVFRPLLVDALHKQDADVIGRFADFFEEIFETGDDEAQNVIWLKFFRWLFSHESELEQFLPACKPATRRAMRDATKSWRVSDSMLSKLSC